MGLRKLVEFKSECDMIIVDCSAGRKKIHLKIQLFSAVIISVGNTLGGLPSGMTEDEYLAGKFLCSGIRLLRMCFTVWESWRYSVRECSASRSAAKIASSSRNSRYPTIRFPCSCR